MNDLFLIFSAHFDRDKGLDWGRLTLNSLSKGVQKVWMATSSYSSAQISEGFHSKGGMLPPPYRCKNLPNYFVEVQPLNLKQVKGVEGNFYKILPYSVTTDKGGSRGDFGIHRDANVPGSFGCIVMAGDRFADFEATMKGISAKMLPLFVQYS